MYSFKINGRNYEAPMGFGEITIERYAAFTATVAPLAPNAPQATKRPSKMKFMQRLTEKLNAARIGLQRDPLNEYEQRLAYDRAFLCHWMKLDASLADMITDEDVMQIAAFISKSWSAWKPSTIPSFEYDGRVWQVDYSMDCLGSVVDPSDMQQVMAAVCKSGGKRMNPRKWGGVSLDIAASILCEIKRRHTIVAPIIGASILEAFNLTGRDNNGK